MGFNNSWLILYLQANVHVWLTKDKTPDNISYSNCEHGTQISCRISTEIMLILACDLHYSIKLISKKLLLCSMIKDSLTIITHSTTKMFVFKSLTNHNKEVMLNTQHKTCQTYYLELINKNSEVFHRSGLHNVLITPRHI